MNKVIAVFIIIILAFALSTLEPNYEVFEMDSYTFEEVYNYENPWDDVQMVLGLETYICRGEENRIVFYNRKATTNKWLFAMRTDQWCVVYIKLEQEE